MTTPRSLTTKVGCTTHLPIPSGTNALVEVAEVETGPKAADRVRGTKESQHSSQAASNCCSTKGFQGGREDMWY